jgi:hypothetical protein
MNVTVGGWDLARRHLEGGLNTRWQDGALAGIRVVVDDQAEHCLDVIYRAALASRQGLLDD